MRLLVPFTVAALLCITAVESRAVAPTPVATSSDIDNAMNVLPADVKKDLNTSLPAEVPRSIPPPPMSQHCRELLAEIERARYTPESHDLPPASPYHNPRYPQPVVAPADSLQIDASNGINDRRNGGYGRRARLEAQFARECR